MAVRHPTVPSVPLCRGLAEGLLTNTDAQRWAGKPCFLQPALRGGFYDLAFLR